jgi:hypothetical protein
MFTFFKRQPEQDTTDVWFDVKTGEVVDLSDVPRSTQVTLSVPPPSMAYQPPTSSPAPRSAPRSASPPTSDDDDDSLGFVSGLVLGTILLSDD